MTGPPVIVPYYEDDTVTLLLGDAATCAATLTPGSVQTVVTSPPYFGLRDYGVDGQLGAEDSPAKFVANLVAVFEAIRPALADDGTLWVNLGDSYAGSGKGREADGTHREGGKQGTSRGTIEGYLAKTFGDRPAKNMLGVPWRFAFAMQDAGWILRNDIIWAKPNAMPESVTDRFSTKHEHLFLFTKSARYYFDLDAVKVPLAESSIVRLAQDIDNQVGSARSHGGAKANGNLKAAGDVDGGTNPGDVWTIATRPFAGAHFATFPPELPQRCILAGTRAAGKRCDCADLIGSPTGTRLDDDPSLQTGRGGMNRPRGDNEGRRNITRREQRHHAHELTTSPHRSVIETMAGPAFAHYIRLDASGARPLPETLRVDLLARGWITNPTPCDHPDMPADIVLDPFSGSATTGMVATKHGRSYIGIDLNADYHNLALTTRLAQGVLA